MKPDAAGDKLKTDVLIIGGGIVGASTALFLRKLGARTVLLEAALCGSKASGVNYGGVRRQGRSLELLPLSQRAFELWSDLPSLIGIDGEYIRSGHLKLARTQEDFNALQAYRERTRGMGMHLQLLSGQTLRQRYPWIGPHVHGASLCPEDGHANPRLVSPAFARAAAAAGAIVREHTRVLRIRQDGAGFIAECDNGLVVQSEQLVNCAGAWGAVLSQQLGQEAPLQAIHPAMAVTEPLPSFIDVNIGMQGGGAYLRQVARGNCIIGGARGLAIDTNYATPGTDAIITIMRRLIELVPRLRYAQLIRSWSGYEGRFEDGKPVLGPSGKIPGLFHAFGFCGEGFQTGPAVGEVLANLIVRGRTDVPIAAFSIQRFEQHAGNGPDRTLVSRAEKVQ